MRLCSICPVEIATGCENVTWTEHDGRIHAFECKPVSFVMVKSNCGSA